MADPTIETVLTDITKLLRQLLENQQAIHRDLVTVIANVETVNQQVKEKFEDLHGCLRDGIYSDGFDPEEFHRLRLDVTEIERRTREAADA